MQTFKTGMKVKGLWVFLVNKVKRDKEWIIPYDVMYSMISSGPYVWIETLILLRMKTSLWVVPPQFHSGLTMLGHFKCCSIESYDDQCGAMYNQPWITTASSCLSLALTQPI